MVMYNIVYCWFSILQHFCVSIPASFSEWFFISFWLLTLAFCLLDLLLFLKKEKCLLALIVGDGFTLFLSDVLIRF